MNQFITWRWKTRQRSITREIGRLVICLTKKYEAIIGIQHKNANHFVSFVSVVVSILFFAQNTPS